MLALGLLGAVVAVQAPGAMASAAVVDQASVLADSITRPWPSLQLRDGSFPDYVLATSPTNTDRYGPAIMGAALIRHGIKVRSRVLVQSGLRSIDFALRQPVPWPRANQRFQDFAFTEGYLAFSMRPSNLRVTASRDLIARWRARLQGIVPVAESSALAMPLNQALVDQLTYLELLSSGLKSSVPGSVLAKPADTVAAVGRVLDSILAVHESGLVVNGPAGDSLMLGDPPDFPPAYHALSSALLARIVQFVPADSTRLAPLRSQLARAAAASALMIAPDGDLAYSGRSAEEAWVLTMTTFSARQAYMVCPACSPPGAIATVASGALKRLADQHLNPKWGMLLTPSMRFGARRVVPALDAYVSAVAYTGLAILGLSWAESLQPLPSDSWDPPESTSIGSGRGGLGTARTGNSWLAVRSGDGFGDPRLASGLVAAKAKVGDGWVDLVVAPPRVPRWSSAFGLAVIDGWSLGLMRSATISTKPRGVSMSGAFVDASGVPIDGADPAGFDFTATDCGVDIDSSSQARVGVGIAIAIPAGSVTRTSDGALEWADGRIVAGPGNFVQVTAAGPTVAAPQTVRLLAGVKAGSESPLSLRIVAKACSPTG